MPLADKYVDATVFIVDGRGGIPVGTGFLLYAIRDPGGEGIYYLVTCRHVVENLSSPRVRWRRQDDTTNDEPLGRPYYHPDHPVDADVAVYIVRPPPRKPQSFPSPKRRPSTAVPIRYHADADSLTPYGEHAVAGALEKGIGHDVFYVGFLDQIPSMDDLVPMVRSGVLGAWDQPDVPVGREGAPEAEWVWISPAHLLDVRTVEGFSGSPCYVQFPKEEEPFLVRDRLPQTYERWRMQYEVRKREEKRRPKTDTQLIGMLAGFWSRAGIAVVIPIGTILETLEQEELLEDREDRKKMAEEAEAKRRRPGPAEPASSRAGPDPERLSLEGPWEDAPRAIEAGNSDDWDEEQN